MSWTSDLSKLRARSWEERALVMEALVWLGLFRAAVLLLPFRRVIALLGLTEGETHAEVDATLAARALRVGWAVRAAAARTPWQSACLGQALAGIAMLRRRGLPGTLYLGVARGVAAREELQAHAWLRCGGGVLTGAGGHERFSVISAFRGA